MAKVAACKEFLLTVDLASGEALVSASTETPKEFVLDTSKSLERNKIFIDYLVEAALVGAIDYESLALRYELSKRRQFTDCVNCTIKSLITELESNRLLIN